MVQLDREKSFLTWAFLFAIALSEGCHGGFNPVTMDAQSLQRMDLLDAHS